MSILTLLRKLPAAFLAPLMLLAGLSFARQSFTCVYDGVTRAKCCCPAAALERVPDHPQLERGSCCDVDVVAYAAPSSTATDRIASVSPPPCVVVARTSSFAAPAIEIETFAPAFTRRGPRSTAGPPLYLKHRSLLL